MTHFWILITLSFIWLKFNQWYIHFLNSSYYIKNKLLELACEILRSFFWNFLHQPEISTGYIVHSLEEKVTIVSSGKLYPFKIEISFFMFLWLCQICPSWLLSACASDINENSERTRKKMFLRIFPRSSVWVLNVNTYIHVCFRNHFNLVF